MRYEIQSTASGTMNILYSPLEGSWLKTAAPSSSAKVALLEHLSSSARVALLFLSPEVVSMLDTSV